MATGRVKAQRVPRTAKELGHALERTKLGWSRADREFAQQVALYIAERLDRIEQALTNGHAKPKRKPSAWNTFFAKGMKAGKSAQQIGEEWRARKAPKGDEA